MNCAFCPHHKCYTDGQNCTKFTQEEACALYGEGDIEMMRASSATESRNYMKMTRLEESAFFAKELGVKKIGIAFCIGLANEAHFCAQYFKNQGFAVESVCCKVCSVDKDLLELEKIKSGKREAMCNPRMQAELLNAAGTELNFIVGLCVGHDSLFYKHAQAVTTTLVVKDRVLVHNPVMALYTADGYYANLMEPLEDE